MKCNLLHTGPGGAMANLSANHPLGIWFASRYRDGPDSVCLKPPWVGVRPLHLLLSNIVL